LGNNYEIKYWFHQKNGGRKPSKILANKLKFWSPYSIHEIHRTGAGVVRDLLDGTTYNHIVLRYVDAAYRCGLYHRKGLIVDVDDDPSEKFRSFCMNPGANLRIRMYYLFCYLLTRLHTKRFMNQASHLFFSNSEQATYPNSSYLPNIPFTKNLPGPEAHFNPDSRVILFVGTMSYEPNWIGMNWFISRVWKQVRKKFPGAELRIVGKGTPPGLSKKWRATPGVHLPGYVKDLQREYDCASLVVAPIFQGAGTNIKVLEAMSARRCCVMTPFAARGLQDVLTHRENVFIAGDHSGFYQIIAELFENPQLNNQVRENAGVTIQRYFSEDVFFGKINAFFNQPTDCTEQ